MWRRRRKLRGDSVPAQPTTLRMAVVLSSLQQYTDLMVTFPSIMILSRLLTPAQIGVYSVAVTFVNLVHMLRDFGTSEYIVQADRLDTGKPQTAFTITWIIAWALAAALFFASPLIAAFFREPDLTQVLRILSITYLLLPIGSTTGSMLVRDLQFGIRYKINTSQLVVQNAVTIVLAWYGFGYFSPAWGAVAGMLTTVAGCLYWGRHYRIRGLGLAHWREVGDFGVKKTVGSIMNRLGDSAPDFVIGRMLGFSAVGMFSRGFGLVRLFRDNVSAAIGTVAYSALSQRHREGRSAAELYLRSITFITGLGWPFLGFASLMAFPIIRIFFGDQWDMAVPILRLLAIQVAISLVVMHYQDLLTAIGRVGTATAWVTIWQMLTVATLLIAASYGLVAIAAALIPTTVVLVGLVVIGIARETGIGLRAYLHALAPSALLALTTLVPVAGCRLVYPPAADALWGPILCAGAAALAGAVIGGLWTRHPLWLEIVQAYRHRRPRRENASA
ncbi:lipopolysaccharide biosynthesis protein [Salinisphaera sp. LB1]|uniref:lipopolysaccharide biosynthesis protein n=1 Tax=Salinisphaera sp. LB1 TaxID=2183911 RepID=UPI000D7E751E|nr:lipopolysaccharide biosynthesis protein [Salinisphaera sp. LB1]AWN14290.1 Membrane protein involved in the export of O-antigen and teichoic acid [Salinisphaera sp. LB1]